MRAYPRLRERNRAAAIDPENETWRGDESNDAVGACARAGASAVPGTEAAMMNRHRLLLVVGNATIAAIFLYYLTADRPVHAFAGRLAGSVVFYNIVVEILWRSRLNPRRRPPR
jgi:hypothetical protein